MSTILSTILITAPLAFIVGWLVSKAVFVHLATARRQAVAVGEQDTVRMPNPSAAPATNTPNNSQIHKAAQILKQQLTKSQANYQSLLNEAQLLKEAVAEREHRLLELKHQLSVTTIPPEEAKAAGLENVQQAKDRRSLEKRINAHELEIANLRRELITVEIASDTAKSRFSKWRIKFKPFAKQFRQQRMIISELREELRQRELRREQEAVEHQHALNAATSAEADKQKAAITHAEPAAAPVASSGMPPPVKPIEQQDSLKALKGIGPALQKKLHNQGIFRLQQLAEMNADELCKLGKSLGVSQKLIHKNDWSKQARELLGIAEKSADTETTSDKEAVPA